MNLEFEKFSKIKELLTRPIFGLLGPKHIVFGPYKPQYQYKAWLNLKN